MRQRGVQRIKQTAGRVTGKMNEGGGAGCNNQIADKVWDELLHKCANDA
jgi:hypothetical protein